MTLTRSIQRPAIHAGMPCPRCSGSMFLENQIEGEAELCCQACGYSQVPISISSFLELAGEMADASVPKKGNRATHRRAPASNGVNL